MKRHIYLFFILCLLLNEIYAQQRPFNVAVYTRAREVNMMEDTEWRASSWETISSQLDVDKIYLEIHRDLLIIEKDRMQEHINFFKEKGLKVGGGITYTIDESNNFQTFCYSKPEDRSKATEIIEAAAELFDEVILDDFFFTSCKCNECIQAKGNRTWDEYRLELMTGAANDVILGPAKAVNPDVKVIVKYPNWYDHFHELGFNLETQPAIFDGLYTGTETRDAVNSNQHLQPYLGFQIFRYFEQLKPGHNYGGWVDTYGSPNYDRYAEQLWLTLFAKAPEMTLFEYSAMTAPLREQLLPSWQNEETSFDYGSFTMENRTMASAAQHALEQIGPVIPRLGNPIGIKTYRPYHADGEDFLPSYLGMIGIPLEIVSDFPFDDPIVLLTAQAASDPEILQKIEGQLVKGNDVVITSGLLQVLQDKGMDQIVDVKYSPRKAMVKDYLIRYRQVSGDRSILIPQLEYYTNDSWEVISGMDNGLGWPVLHRGQYGAGNLYILTIPENFRDLYSFPEPVLNMIRDILTTGLPYKLQGTSQIAVFPYDNQVMIVESFNDSPSEISLVTSEKSDGLTDILAGQELEMEVIPEVNFFGRTIIPERYRYSLILPPHSFVVLESH